MTESQYPFPVVSANTRNKVLERFYITSSGHHAELLAVSPNYLELTEHVAFEAIDQLGRVNQSLVDVLGEHVPKAPINEDHHRRLYIVGTALVMEALAMEDRGTFNTVVEKWIPDDSPLKRFRSVLEYFEGIQMPQNSLEEVRRFPRIPNNQDNLTFCLNTVAQQHPILQARMVRFGGRVAFHAFNFAWPNQEAPMVVNRDEQGARHRLSALKAMGVDAIS